LGLSEQREFSAQISAVERIIIGQKISLVKLDALFASLQYRAFRGELTCRDAERELEMAG
jgi:type I restriction enzyme S subunit